MVDSRNACSVLARQRLRPAPPPTRPGAATTTAPGHRRSSSWSSARDGRACATASVTGPVPRRRARARTRRPRCGRRAQPPQSSRSRRSKLISCFDLAVAAPVARRARHRAGSAARRPAARPRCVGSLLPGRERGDLVGARARPWLPAQPLRLVQPRHTSTARAAATRSSRTRRPAVAAHLLDEAVAPRSRARSPRDPAPQQVDERLLDLGTRAVALLAATAAAGVRAPGHARRAAAPRRARRRGTRRAPPGHVAAQPGPAPGASGSSP